MFITICIIIVLFLPYLAVPISIAYRNFNLTSQDKALPYLTTSLILFCWPILFLWLVDILSPYDKQKTCFSPEAGFLVFNIFFIIPASLLIQLSASTLFIKINSKNTQ